MVLSYMSVYLLYTASEKVNFFSVDNNFVIKSTKLDNIWQNSVFHTNVVWLQVYDQNRIP